MSEPLIELVNATVTFSDGPPWARRHVPAVLSTTISVNTGETLGIVGESGSGKSTLGRLCLGLIRPSHGTVTFNGRNFNRTELRGQLQIVGQHPDSSLNPRLKNGTSIAEPLIITKSGSRQERRSRVIEMLELVGLDTSLADRYPHELSGGQRQRVAIARALITNPRLIVFDEVVSALDVSVQAQILSLIKELQAKNGFAAIFISHDLSAVAYVSHRIAVMYAGEIVDIAPSLAFYGRAAHPYARALQAAVSPAKHSGYRLLDAPTRPPNMACPLALRCPLAVERCQREKPAAREIEGQRVACHRAEEVAQDLLGQLPLQLLKSDS